MAFLVLRALLVVMLCMIAGVEAVAAAAQKPNILFVLTDDQDWHMQSLDYMPLLHKHVVQEGTLFDRHYCTVSVCCPSRVNLWTGKAAHNVGIQQYMAVA